MPRPNVIQRLRELQHSPAAQGWLPPDMLRQLAEEADLPVSEIYAVASYYPEFHLEKPKRLRIEVCTALPCQMRSGEALYRSIEAFAAGRDDVELGRCPCLGACDHAPAMTWNGVLQTSDANLPPSHWPKTLFKETKSFLSGSVPAQQRPPRGIHGPFHTNPYVAGDEPFGIVKALLEIAENNLRHAANESHEACPNPFPSELVLQAINESGLVGMGGSGQPTFARKWKDVYDQMCTAGLERTAYVVCNADESEPGTLKDREILRNLPLQLVEAMIIGGLTLRATKGYIYIRHEYQEQIHELRTAIRRAREERLLGSNLGDTDLSFDLEIFISPGGYVMGEQTALLEALEGKRGQPRNQIGDRGLIALPMYGGLWGQPTVVNNVETWIYVPLILSKCLGKTDPPTFEPKNAQQLKKTLPKWVAVTGDVQNPGVFELGRHGNGQLPTFGEVIYGRARGMINPSRKMLAFAPSGPSFGFFPNRPEFVEIPLDFRRRKLGRAREDEVKNGRPPLPTVGSGAIIVLDDSRCVVDATLNFTRFFRNESCGKCVPCRVGTQNLVDLIKVTCRLPADRGTGTETPFYDNLVEHMRRLILLMEEGSICGLGQFSTEPLRTLLEFWPDVLREHLDERKCRANVCFTPRGTFA